MGQISYIDILRPFAQISKKKDFSQAGVWNRTWNFVGKTIGLFWDFFIATGSLQFCRHGLIFKLRPLLVGKLSNLVHLCNKLEYITFQNLTRIHDHPNLHRPPYPTFMGYQSLNDTLSRLSRQQATQTTKFHPHGIFVPNDTLPLKPPMTSYLEEVMGRGSKDFGTYNRGWDFMPWNPEFGTAIFGF